jgi:5-methylcytosine-specific restriction protein A
VPKAAKTFKPTSVRTYDNRRGTRTERGYDNRWLRASKLFLAEHPLCVQCEREGKSEGAYCVDHIIPHRGDVGLFWDSDNWQPLCRRHHNQKSRKEMNRGQGDRYVVCGLPGTGKTTYVNERKQHGAIVWDYDVIAHAVCGAEIHSLPQDMTTHMLAMLDALVQSVAMIGCEREVWIICVDVRRAGTIARLLGAEVVRLQCDETERVKRLSMRC